MITATDTLAITSTCTCTCGSTACGCRCRDCSWSRGCVDPSLCGLDYLVCEICWEEKERARNEAAEDDAHYTLICRMEDEGASPEEIEDEERSYASRRSWNV